MTQSLISPSSMGLTNKVIKELSSYDDFVNFYVQIDQAVNGFSWMKADALKQMEDKLGGSSLKAMSKELGENYSTLVSYIRVSRAFPINKRDEQASFTMHFQASFADKYNTADKTFDGNEREKWLQKAMDDNLSTKTLQKEIRSSKGSKSNREQTEEEIMYRRITDSIRQGLYILEKKAVDGGAREQSIISEIMRIIEEYGKI